MLIVGLDTVMSFVLSEITEWCSAPLIPCQFILIEFILCVQSLEAVLKKSSLKKQSDETAVKYTSKQNQAEFVHAKRLWSRPTKLGLSNAKVTSPFGFRISFLIHNKSFVVFTTSMD